MTMNEHTRRSYDEQLQHLTDLILQMGGHLRELVLDTKDALRERDKQNVKDAKATDKEINALDLKIEEEATVILALQNPMAIDLRFVTSVLKITGMLERAGDLAKNTVKRSVRMGDFVPEENIAKMERMMDVLVEMLDLALKAFEEKDANKAIEVWKRDEEIDVLYAEIFQAMQTQMEQDPKKVEVCTQVVFSAKNIERLADYVTKLGKNVYYVAAGERPSKDMLKND